MPSPILNPVPGTTRRNNGGYDSDSGLDILVPDGTPVVSCSDGVLVYSEPGHTPWVEDTNSKVPGFQGPKSILLKLDKPFVRAGITVRFAWYTHLQEVSISVPDGSPPVKVKRGQVIGKSGIGNRVPHLHFGLVEDRNQSKFLPHREIARLVWDEAEEDSNPDPGPPPSTSKVHRTPDRLKVFSGTRGDRGMVTRVFMNEKEISTTSVRVDVHGGKVWVSVGGKPSETIEVESVEIDIAYRPKEV